MGKTGNRFGRFFSLIKGRERYIDKDEMVAQFTDGRTTHLSGMTNAEFHEMCDCIEARFQQDTYAYKEKVRKARASVLKRVSKLGISTIDNWDEVNAFLASPRIAGKLLYEMDLDELNALIKKLEAILQRGGLKGAREAESAKAIEDLTRAMATQTTTTNHKYLS